MEVNNPYTPPKSNLVNEPMPESFRAGSISAGQLNLAGWLAIFYVFLSVALLVVSFMSAESESASLDMTSYALTIVSLIIWAYLLIVLRKFMQERFGLSGLGVYVALLILFSALLSLFSFLPEQTDNTDPFTVEMIVYFVSLIPFGILTILFGRRLLSVKVPYPSLKALSWLTILTGISMATVILFVLAVPLGIAADIFLASLFFNGRREVTSGVDLSSTGVKQTA